MKDCLRTITCVNKKKALIAVFLFTLLLLAIVLRLPQFNPIKQRGGFGLFGDTFLYHNIAYNLYVGNGFSGTPDARAYGIKNNKFPLKKEPTATRTPVYPVFMCMIYKLSGGNTMVLNWKEEWYNVRLVQGILDAFVCLMIFYIVTVIIPSSVIPALIASVLYCFSFYNIYYTNALLTESLTTFLVTSFILFSVLGLRDFKRDKWIIYAGICMGFVSLTRPEYILFIPAFTILIYFYSSKNNVHKFNKPLLFLLAAIMIILPWSVRNYMTFKKPIIVSVSGLGNSLFLGTFEDNKRQKVWGRIPKNNFNEKQKKIIDKLQKKYKEYFYNGSIKIREVDNAFMTIAMHRIRSKPFETFRIWIKRIPSLWLHKYTQYHNLEPKGFFFVFYFITSLFAICFSQKEERKMMMPIGLLFIYVNAIYLPLHVEPRYGAPMMPGIISMAGIGIWIMIKNANTFIKNITKNCLLFHKNI